MRAEMGLPSVKGDDEHGGGMTGGFGGSMGGAGQGGKGKRPISVKFEIPYFTTSGIQVRYLKIIEPKVSAVAIRALLTICTSLLAPSFTPLRCNWLRIRFCTLQVACNRGPFSSVLFDPFGLLGHGLSATRSGTVRWPAEASEAVLILSCYAL